MDQPSHEALYHLRSVLLLFARNDGIRSYRATDRADGRVRRSFLDEPRPNGHGLAEPVPMPKVPPPIPDFLDMA
jgi:hypothetical protein